MPIRQGYADEVCVVTSGEMMSLYAASNIAQAVQSFSRLKYAALKGLIFNAQGVEDEEELVWKAAREMNTGVLKRIPRDSLVQRAENEGQTVLQFAPDSDQAHHYRALADIMMEGL